jgi:GTP cyclohydrolase I
MNNIKIGNIFKKHTDDNEVNVKGRERLITDILTYIGEDISREGLKDTPSRVIKMYKEVFKGYNPQLKPQITIFNNNMDGMKYDEMIIDTGNYYSFCEHHMLPFYGKYYFAYIPNDKIVGLSKVSRVVDYYSCKLQVQERLIKEILDEIELRIQPKGIAMIMKGKHLCKEMRGAKNHGEMVTSDMRGVFRTKPEARTEFLSIINMK